jgi:hypothetical protein
MYSYSLIVSGERFGLWLEVEQLINREKVHSVGVLLFCSQLDFEMEENA